MKKEVSTKQTTINMCKMLVNCILSLTERVKCNFLAVECYIFFQ